MFQVSTVGDDLSWDPVLKLKRLLNHPLVHPWRTWDHPVVKPCPLELETCHSPVLQEVVAVVTAKGGEDKCRH